MASARPWLTSGPTAITPCPVSQSWFGALASPITVTPACFASCTASEPTPPAAPDTTTVSPGRSATARTADRTGVEMEALTAVSVAALALIDMIKSVDPAASIEAVRVLRKEGGKTGTWVRAS